MDDFTPSPPSDNETTEEKAGDTPKTVTDETAAEDADTEAERTGESTNEAENAEKLDLVLETQQQLLERIDSLNNLFSKRILYTDHEEKIVDEMHKELQKYKEDLYAQLIRPILLDVIEVRDSIMRIAAVFLAKPEDEQCIPNKTFADYAFDLQDILEKNNVEIYRSKTGDDFIPIRQKVVKKVTASDETLHGRVAESLSCGYSYGGKVISPEKITIYYYEKPVEEVKKSEVNENG